MATRVWTDKDERQYKHIKANELKRGRSPSRAEEIAARTVNKQRRETGRTISPQSRGAGNPHTSLNYRSKQELLNRARELNIKGRSSMLKDELVNAIRRRQ